jgi:hypothetical protein
MGFAFITWALTGLCEVHAGVSRLFNEINQERWLARENTGMNQSRGL